MRRMPLMVFQRVDIGDEFDKYPVFMGFFIFMVCAIVVYALKAIFYDSVDEFVQGMIVEATGMLFDLLIFGVLVAWVSKRAELSQLVRRYNEEIEDYLGVDTDEARAYIKSRILRLNKIGKTPISLEGAYLQGVDLRGADLRRTSIRSANLERANLSEANLSWSSLSDAYIMNTNFDEADFTGVFITEEELKNSSTEGVKGLQAF